ncbi:PREDICTED: TIFY [Prunus dulcis]|uniref:Protein TIFY n=1 Tax=Prunus dulcis TaxID=3755 RepID=A0A5E4GJF6_PRUDU|nr:protein TIFY 5A-like isoform X1 [Prunus dulcis]VVA39733.1 PREDICTED: TIFY [Prunus dulcis]
MPTPSPPLETPMRFQLASLFFPRIFLRGDWTLDQQQQITIFYNGQVFVSDMTELQARAMILLAAGDMAERGISSVSNAALLALQSQIYGPPGVSMKRSLQSFLQKRKKRSQEASPYHSLQ